MKGWFIMKNFVKKFRKALRDTFAGFAVVGAGALFAAMVLEVYAFFAYTDCFFTTSPNYSSLETTAPVLWKMTVGLFVVTVICLLVCIACYYIFQATKKRR